MPVYGFACAACGDEFDRSRPISEAHLPVHCPTCGSGSTARIYQPIAVLRARGIVAAPIGVTERAASVAHAPGCACCHPARLRQPATEGVR